MWAQYETILDDCLHQDIDLELDLDLEGTTENNPF